MATAQEYRRYAAECLALAQAEENSKDKAGYVLMAANWRALAERLENEPKFVSTSPEFLVAGGGARSTFR